MPSKLIQKNYNHFKDFRTFTDTKMFQKNSAKRILLKEKK